MYESFYGLSELPFELTANARFLFLSPKHREALSALQYGLLAAKAVTAIVGEAGTGKTTLLQAALESDRCRHVRCVYLNNPVLDRADFVHTLSSKLNLGADAAASKAAFLSALEQRLREEHLRGEVTALVIDEAQSLSTELLEEVRLLSNLETPRAKLLPIVLAGQPELSERLEQPQLRQLKQRVTARCELPPFEFVETAEYIAARLRTAGGVPSRLFSLEAVTLVHEASAGIARTINVICDNALLTGMAAGARRVDRATVADVCRDLHLATGLAVTSPERAASSDTPALGESVNAGSDAAEPQPPLEPVVTATGRALDRFRRLPFRMRTKPAVATGPTRILTDEPIR